MKIGIFETEHFEAAYAVIKLFDNGKNDITIFTYDHSYRQFQYLFNDELDKFEWIVKEPSASKIQFIRRVWLYVKRNKLELMYFNTISNNFIFYALAIASLKGVRVIVTLHDTNGYFQFKPAFSIRRWIRFIGKRILIETVKEFNVISSTMVSYLKERLPASKLVHCIPGAVFENLFPDNVSLEISTPMKIVIPGSIDERRRNYEFAFELLKEINKKKLPVLMVFLGGFNEQYGSRIMEKCKSYRLTYSNLQFYEESIVDQPEFDRVMNEAHFIFIPTVIDTILFDAVLETYGKTISSGNISDIIKHGKPFIAPKALTIPKDMESSCFRYGSVDEITSLINTLLDQPDRYKPWRDSALKNSLEYTPEKVRERNASIFCI